MAICEQSPAGPASAAAQNDPILETAGNLRQ